MVIIRVSRSKEKAMLNTVRVLRRLLRNAFFVTNRVNVIGLLQKGPGTGRRRQARPSPPRIDEVPRDRQPGQIRFVPCPECSCPPSQFCSASVLFESGSRQGRCFSTSIVSCINRAHKWRSSSGLDDKCHPRLDTTITTAQPCTKSRSILANGGTKRPSHAEGAYSHCGSRRRLP